MGWRWSAINPLPPTPNKPLADLGGKPMVVRVAERARASGATRIIVATDHEDIAALQFFCDGIQPPFGDETARAAAALGVIAHLPLRRVSKS